MKILALDAATEACSVALKIDDDVISLFEVCPQQHSQKLLPFVDQVLSEAGIRLNQLDALVYGQGPGSFTGVRIGVAITQGLAYGADLPVVGVSNLAAMAQEAIQLESSDRVLSAIDARMSEIYLGYYENVQGIARSMTPEQVLKPEAIVLPDAWQGPEILGVGTGWQTYAELLNGKCNAQVSSISLPKAEFMLPLALQELDNGTGKQAEEAQPNYVRDEVTWKKLPGR